MSEWESTILPDGWKLVVIGEVDSTNDEVRRHEGVSEGLVVVAETQTAGRGRRGSAWLSVPGESLTFSVLLKPTVAKSLWPRLSLAAGLAVADALERSGLDARIKWPNDILISGRKISGILVEAGSDHVVVGIGLNIGTREFPDGLEATSMFMESGREIPRSEVLSGICRSLGAWSQEIGSGFPRLLELVRERCALTGEEVRLTSGDRRVEGRVIEIGDGGEIVVQTNQGRESFLQAHDVRLIAGR